MCTFFVLQCPKKKLINFFLKKYIMHLIPMQILRIIRRWWWRRPSLRWWQCLTERLGDEHLKGVKLVMQSLIFVLLSVYSLKQQMMVLSNLRRLLRQLSHDSRVRSVECLPTLYYAPDTLTVSQPNSQNLVGDDPLISGGRL